MTPPHDPRRAGRPDEAAPYDERDGVRQGADVPDEPDFAEEHTPSETDPPNARPDDGSPDERWDDPTGV